MSSSGQFVGLGSQRYRVERPWGKLPPEASYAGIADVTVMSSGQVAVLRRSDPAILIFEPDGFLADTWSMPDLVAGHYIRACSSGRLLLSDFDGHRIFVLTEDGHCERILGDRDRPRFGQPFNHPADAVEAPNGEIFVADGYGNSCVHRFAPDGTWIATWGRPGRGTLEFSTPHAIAIDRAGRLLVGDRENNRVQILDRSGRWMGEIGGLYKPMAVEPTPDGGVLITDQTPRLSLVSANGELIGRCRTFGTVGHGVALGPDGSIFVAEMGPDTLTRFAPIS
jgi:sugar lactone lactonase YvrE